MGQGEQYLFLINDKSVPTFVPTLKMRSFYNNIIEIQEKERERRILILLPLYYEKFYRFSLFFRWLGMIQKSGDKFGDRTAFLSCGAGGFNLKATI